MKATPQTLLLTGLSSIAFSVALAIVNAALKSGDAYTYDSSPARVFVVFENLFLWGGVVVMLGGALAWIVKVGVRAARDN